MKWQPIETAPKDGTKLWLYDWLGNYYAAHWHDFTEQGFDSCWIDENELTPIQPTHWMPLPKPPGGES